MKALIVEDEYLSRTMLISFLEPYATCDTASDGKEAVKILQEAYNNNERYDLVCLDIMMPEMDGHEVLSRFRQIERENNVSEQESATVFMTTTLDDARNVMSAFNLGRCQAYLIKPIMRERLEAHLREFLFAN